MTNYNDFEVMLTTFDNPFNPFIDYQSWRNFDIANKHLTCERLARIVKLSDEMSQTEIDEETERAMDEIIKFDVEDKFQKLYYDKRNNTYKLAHELTQNEHID